MGKTIEGEIKEVERNLAKSDSCHENSLKTVARSFIASLLMVLRQAMPEPVQHCQRP
jgi:hypothetical protein